jgi:hypothetical protein
MRANRWNRGATFFSHWFNAGLYLDAWTGFKVFTLPGSHYCLGGTWNLEAGWLRVTVRVPERLAFLTE